MAGNRASWEVIGEPLGGGGQSEGSDSRFELRLALSKQTPTTVAILEFRSDRPHLSSQFPSKAYRAY